MNTEIRIYVADLAAYNNGKLHGVWINACDDLEDIQEQINKMLASSPEGFAEEYAIHDYEGFGGYSLGEYEGIEAAHEIACFIEEYPDFGGELLNNFGGDLTKPEQRQKKIIAAVINHWLIMRRSSQRKQHRFLKTFLTISIMKEWGVIWN